MPSGRREELLTRAYEYVLAHNITDLSLRPLAAAIDSSPRVLLFLFDSKDGLLRAVLDRARAEELAFLNQIDTTDLAAVLHATWQWLANPAHRPLLTLWLESYTRSLTDPAGPWSGFAARTVQDWLDVLSHTGATEAHCTHALALLRGALLDLLATGDTERITAALASERGGAGGDVA